METGCIFFPCESQGPCWHCELTQEFQCLFSPAVPAPQPGSDRGSVVIAQFPHWCFGSSCSAPQHFLLNLPRWQEDSKHPVHVPWDIFPLSLFSALLWFATGWGKTGSRQDSAVAGAFKEGKSWVSQLKALLRNLRSATNTEELTPMSFWHAANCALPAATSTHGPWMRAWGNAAFLFPRVICFP